MGITHSGQHERQPLYVITAAVLAGFFFVYLALTPGTIAGMGYTGEEIKAGEDIVQFAASVLGLAPRPQAIQACRNGYLTVAFDLPFILLGRCMPGDGVFWVDFMVAVESILTTALTLALLFVWVHRITRCLKTSLGLTVMAGFCTLYWPYAYIGLENKVSLSLLCAGFIAIEARSPDRWSRSIALALSAGCALGLKSNGLFLLPPVAYLALHFMRRQRATDMRVRELLARGVLVAGIVGALYAVGLSTRLPFWEAAGGMAGFLRYWLPRDALAPVFHAVGLLASPNKGLFVYVPVAILAISALPATIRESRPIGVLFLLTLASLVSGASLTRFWSDETWGPRYLHATTGPMVLCVASAIAKRGKAFRLWLSAGAVAGFCVALLGSLFAYGALHQAAIRSDQSTLEALQGDIVWNHVLFNTRLLKIWVRPGAPAVWSPEHQWFYEKPAGARPWPSVDLRPFAAPQSLLLRAWSVPKSGVLAILWPVLLAAGLLGVVILSGTSIWTLRRRWRGEGPAS